MFAIRKKWDERDPPPPPLLDTLKCHTKNVVWKHLFLSIRVVYVHTAQCELILLLFLSINNLFPVL